ncbi:uncharacterized protein HaLaN_25738 [Haematococcus lacustris]|uniref:DUF7912 domain-containing protein n=1 Tax=Haematococcus lacustris TaxID=44745 RepID=A0A6A0A314_HAELA|nr:uncharacterized protein HaLaN_25738 [Haematococcus lacustris]
MEEEEEDPLLAGLEVEEAGPGVDTGQVAALVVERKLDIRLDRLDDLYGSPSIDDIEKFSRMLGAALEAALGPELAGDITREVSSPGAERSLVLPQDLSRFAALPLRVEWRGAEGGTQSQVLQLMEFDEAAGRTRWQVADVRANAPTKGRGLSKRQRAMVLEIPVSNIQRAKVHVDF